MNKARIEDDAFDPLLAMQFTVGLHLLHGVRKKERKKERMNERMNE